MKFNNFNKENNKEDTVESNRLNPTGYRGNKKWDTLEKDAIKIEYTGKSERKYIGKDGSLTALFEGVSNQYQNFDGSFNKIDNSLISEETTEGVFFRNKANNFIARFPEKLEKKNFSMEKGIYKVSFSLTDTHDNILAQDIRTGISGCYKNIPGKVANITNGKTSQIKYYSFCKGGDLEYEVLNDRVKENIIIREKRNKYRFAFIMDLENLVAEMNSDGSISLYSSDIDTSITHELIFEIPAPIMFDADKNVSELIKYDIKDITGAENRYLLVVTADSEWINSEERSLPITIDPQVVISKKSDNSGVISVYRYTRDSLGNSEEFDTTGAYEICSDGSEKKGIKVTVSNPIKTSRMFDKDVRIQRASLIWDILPDSSSNGHFVVKYGDRTIEHFVYEAQENIRIDITDLLGEMITNDKESFSLDFDVSSECASSNTLYLSNQPSALRMLVDYIPTYLVEQNGESIGFDVKRAGSGKINIGNGNVVFEHPDVSSKSAVMPIAVNHVFNAHNKLQPRSTINFDGDPVKMSQRYYMGDGWKLNVQQNLFVPERNDTSKTDDRIHYINAEGGHITFEKKYYYIEDGIKHFVKESLVPKKKKEADGTYKVTIDGKERTVIEALMSDNSLTVQTDKNKTIYFNEKNYEKYYTLGGVEHTINCKDDTNYFEFKTYVIKDGETYYEVNPIYVTADKKFKMSYCGEDREYSVVEKTLDKQIKKDDKGEYFIIRNAVPVGSITRIGQSQEKIYIMTRLNEDESLTLSTESFSEDLVRIDGEISDIDNYLIELSEAKDNYNAQLEDIQNEGLTASRLENLREDYQNLYSEMTSYQIEQTVNLNKEKIGQIKDSIGYNNEVIDKYMMANRPDGYYYGSPLYNPKYINSEYSFIIEQYEINNSGSELQIRELEVSAKMNEYNSKLNKKNDLISNLQKAMEDKNVEEQKAELNKLIKKTETEYNKIQKIKAKKLEEKDKIINAEKKLACDYIYDESGNKLTFDYHGRLIGVCDCYNNSITITYNDNNQLTEIKTSDEQSIGFTYNDEKMLEKMTDVFGRVTRFVYENSMLVQIIYPEDDTRSDYGVPSTKFTYDVNGNLCSITDQSGYRVKLQYGDGWIGICDCTITKAISDRSVSKLGCEEVGDKSTIMEFVSPYLTAVTDDSGTMMYQFDNTGRVLAKYEETSWDGRKNKLSVSNGAVFAYNEKKRSYRVENDETKTNYITNAGFESTSGWGYTSGVSFANTHYTEGVKSLMITGAPDADRRVYQTVSGLPSDRRHYQLSLWAKANSAQIDTERNTGYEDQYLETHTDTELFDENAKRKFGIKAVVKYSDGKSDEFYASFDWYNTEWQLCQLPIRIKNRAVSIDVSFEYGYNLGTAYIDNFRLTAEYGTEKEFSDDGKLLFESDGKIVKCYGYDGSKNPSKVCQIEYAEWLKKPEVSYFVTADAKELSDKGCRITRYYYNSKDSVIMVENHDGIVTEYEYNENGLQTKSYQYHKDDPSSKRYTESTRDDYGRETEVMDARGEVNGETLSQKYTYEWGNSLVKSVESAGGIKTHYGYSHIDDTLIGITTDDNGIEHTNRMGYTANLLTVLDNMSGICYNYKYDGFGRMTEAIINGTSHATFGYSKTTVNEKNCDTEVMTLASGESFTTTEDAEGTYFQSKYNDTVIKQSNTFDEAKRCTKYTEFPAQAKEKVHTFAYDSEGNVTEHTFGSCSAEYQYDKYNRTTKTDYWFTSTDGHNYTYKYKDGLKNELEEVSGFGLTQTFAHDKLERQTESKISNAGGTLYSKKATYLKYGDHSTDIVADLTYKIVNGNADREKYSYDKEGNISAIHENGKLKVKYTYDALNRLIREDNRELSLTTVFEYDNGGNLIRQNEYAYSLAPTDELENENVFVYTYGNEDRSDRLTNFNGEAITYDEKGCPITYRGNACTYTRGTLLASYGNNTFDYDADGIRTKKNSTTFTYVDDKLIRQTGGATIDFIYGASGVAGFKYNNNIYIYRRNLMGDVTHIYDTNGTLKAKYIYDAWGNHRIVTDVDGIGTLNPIRYRGYYYDTETGLYYLKARYYDPETGRFISQDDMAYIVSSHLMGLNLYAYCNNNPVMFTDDSGCLSNEAKWLIGGIAFVGAVALTVVSGGLLAPVFIGMGASIILGGVVEGVISHANGESFTQGFFDGAADGAMWGGIFALGGAGIRTFKMVKNGVALGENMTRVSALAKEGGQITYKGMPGYNIVRRIGGESIARKLSMAHNEAFIKRMMKLGVKLVDYGIDASRPYRSWYYLMETIVSNGYKNLILK